MRSRVTFIGEDNKTNYELYQMLNWRYKVTCLSEDVEMEELRQMETDLVMISMVGKKVNYTSIFKGLSEQMSEVPVVTIGTKAECVPYEEFYNEEQFHKILRPVTGRRILEVCRSIIGGGEYEKKKEVTTGVKEKQHVLVVDDNAMVLRNVKGVLENDYSVAVAPSGFHALISIGKKLPDIILLDYEMPEMNGKQVLEKLKEQEEYEDIPVVFLTSMDTREIVMELLALRPAGYLLKPVEAQVLLDRINDIIGK